MSRRAGIVAANQFDFQNFPGELTSAPERPDSTACDKREVRFGGVTTDAAVASSHRQSGGVFDFRFGGEGLSHKGSIARFYHEREEDTLPEATPAKQIRRKRRLSSLRTADVVEPTGALPAQMNGAPEGNGVRSLRRSFSKAALRLGMGKRKHEDDAQEHVEEAHARPTKKTCLPKIDAHVGRWSGCVEKALDVVMDDINVYEANEEFVHQQFRNPNYASAVMKEWEDRNAMPPPMPPRHPLRLFPYAQGGAFAQARPPPIPPRRPLLPLQGSRPLRPKHVDPTTLAMLEGRAPPPFNPLSFQQVEGIRQFAQGDVHPALRHPDPLRSHPPHTGADSGYHSRNTSEDKTLYSTYAMLEQAIQEQYDVLGVEARGGKKRRKLREAVSGFESWDEFAQAIAEQ